MKYFWYFLCILLFLPLTAVSQDEAAEVAYNSHFQSGYFFYNRRNYNAAATFFDKARSVRPRDYLARIWLGQSFFMGGFYKNALTEWQIALNMGGGGNLLRTKLNYLYYQQGREKQYTYATPFVYMNSFSGYIDKTTVFLRPTGVAVDRKNRVLVAGFRSGSVAILDPNGKLVRHITAGLAKPYGIAVIPGGGFYVSDFGSDRIHRFSEEGTRLGSFGGFGYTNGSFAGPEGLFCDAEGNLFVVDSGNCRVQKFSPRGEFLLTFGKKGREPGEFFRPADVVADTRGRIFVSDAGNRRIQVFDPSGNYLAELGSGKLHEPRGLTLLKDGRLVIADGKHGVMVYNQEDSSWNRMDSLSGKIDRALGVAADANDLLYVADFDSWRIGLFVPERLKYVNLDVRIIRTLEHSYPEVQHYVLVRDREGRTVTGLTEDNFRLFERGQQVHQLNLAPTYAEKDRISLQLLVDKHVSMEPYKGELSRVLRGILGGLDGRDKVQVVNFNRSVWVSQPWVSNLLSPLDGATKGKYEQESVAGKALYRGITELFRYESRPALVLFTTGSFGSDDPWQPYGFDTCLHYARNNGIPVYIVLFGQGEETARLKQLATETGGEVFDALTSGSVFRIKEQLMKQPLSRYALYYRTTTPAALRGRFQEFSVEVRYKGLYGYDRFGYYVPR